MCSNGGAVLAIYSDSPTAEEVGNGAGAINGAREMELKYEEMAMEMEKWRWRNGKQDDKEMEASAEEKWKTAPTSCRQEMEIVVYPLRAP